MAILFLVGLGSFFLWFRKMFLHFELLKLVYPKVIRPDETFIGWNFSLRKYDLDNSEGLLLFIPFFIPEKRFEKYNTKKLRFNNYLLILASLLIVLGSIIMF